MGGGGRLRKHPLGAIPVIHRRLEEKDVEWRAARKAKNKDWRPVLESNFGKALDHQREGFRLSDKRASSDKVLIAEVLDGALREVASAGGAGAAEAESLLAKGPTAAVAAFLGAPFPAAATAQGGAAVEREHATETSAKLALLTSGLDVDTEASDCLDCAAHVASKLPDADIQWEMYLLVRLALAKTVMSQADMQRVLAFFRETIVDFFGLDSAMLAHTGKLSGATDFADPPEAEEAALEPGALVVCPDGPATVTTAPATEDGAYSLATVDGARAVTWPASAVFKAQLLGPPAQPPAALEAETSRRVRGVGAEGEKPSTPAPSGDPAAEPTTAAPPLPGTARCLVVAQPGYLFFRLYALLYERLASVKAAVEASAGQALAEDHPLKAAVRDEQLEVSAAAPVESAPGAPGMDEDEGSPAAAPATLDVDSLVKEGFSGYLGLLGALLNGRLDAGKYDDACRRLMGPGAFLSSTVEKNVIALAKAAQAMVHDRAFTPLAELYAIERAAPSGLSPKRYLLRVKNLLEATSAEVYRLQFDLGARGLSIAALGIARGNDSLAAQASEVPVPAPDPSTSGEDAAPGAGGMEEDAAAER